MPVVRRQRRGERAGITQDELVGKPIDAKTTGRVGEEIDLRHIQVVIAVAFPGDEQQAVVRDQGR